MIISVLDTVGLMIFKIRKSVGEENMIRCGCPPDITMGIGNAHEFMITLSHGIEEEH